VAPSPRVSAQAVLAVVLAAGASLTCGEPAGPDPATVATVVISPDTGAIDTGDSLHLSAVTRNSAGTDLSGKTITWSTLDATLVTVSGTGVVRGRWPGVARVVATSEGKADTARVHVAPRITSLVVTPALDTLRSVFDQLNLAVVAYIDTQQYDGGAYTWERSDTAFLFLSTGGPASRTAVVTARKNGSTIVRVREARGAADSAQVVVRQRVATFRTLAGQISSPYRGCPLPWSVVPLDARGSIVPDAVLTWTSTDTTVARVDASGLITPLAVGTDTVVVSAAGASSRLPLTVVAAPAMVLQLQSAGGDLVTTVGRTQYLRGYGALGGGAATTAPARFHIVSSDSGVATVTPADTVVNLNSVYSNALKVTGRSQGTVTLTPYLCDVAGAPVTFTVTRPQFGIGGGLPAIARTDDSPGLLFISLQDTTGARHYPADPMTVRVSSTDTAVMRSDPPSRQLAGLNSAYFVFAPYVEPGLARLRIEDSAGVYPPDSTPLVQVVYPPLYLYRLNDTLHLGMRQHAFPTWDPTYVYVDRIVGGTPLPVSMTSSDTAIGRIIPASVNLPVGNTGVAIDIASGDTRGVATIAAHASRHRDTSAVIAVGRPAVQLSQIGGMFYPGDPPGLIHVIAADSTTGTPRVASESVIFSVAASDTAVITLDSTALTIPAGQVESPHSAAFSFRGPGTAFITATDPRATPYAYSPGTSFSVTVLEPKLVAETVSLGVDQQWGFSVTVEGVLRQGDVVVHLANNSPTVATLLDSTLTLTPALSYAGLGVNGLAAGTASVVVTAPGWVPDTGLIVVGPSTTDLDAWPPVYGLAVGQTAPLVLLMLAPNGQSRVSAVTKQFTLTPNANLEFTDPSGVPITTVTVAAGQQASPQFWVKGISAGTGTVTISAPNYSPVTKSLTVAP
jgi:Big-like domain-containing protein